MLTTSRRILILSVLGLIVSIAMLYHHVEVGSGLQTSRSYCSINETFDCDAVAKSKYSEFLGLIPMASLGMIFYVMFIVMLTHLRSKADSDNKGAMLLLSSVGVAVSLTMLSISAFIIHKFCLNCSFTYLINLVIFALVLRFILKDGVPIVECVKSGFAGVMEFLRAPLCVRDEYEKQQACLAVRAVILVSLVSLAILCLPRYVILPVIENRSSGNIATTLNPGTAELLEMWRGEVEVVLNTNLEDVPARMDYYYGSKSAPNTIVIFTDYQCVFCSKATQILRQYIDKNVQKVKLVVKNYPLDVACNRKLTRPFHRGACLLAAVTRCAGEVGGVDAFWNEYDKISKFSAYEPSADLRECAENNEKVRVKILLDVESGIGLNILGTPTIYVNNKMLKGLSATNATDLLDAIFTE